MEVVLDNVTRRMQQDLVIDHVSMRLEAGHIYGLQGKNGSGKTMLMRAMCGLIHLTEGEIRVDNKILGKDMEFPESVGALIENPGFVGGDTGINNLKNLAYIKNEITEADIVSCMKKIGLEPYEKKKVRKYSLGMKQKLGIVAAVMEHPKLILLDEPTNALDTESVERLNVILREEIEKYKPVIVIASHDKEELELLCDKIYLVENGKVREREV